MNEWHWIAMGIAFFLSTSFWVRVRVAQHKRWVTFSAISAQLEIELQQVKNEVERACSLRG